MTDRRDFLKTSALSAVALSTASTAIVANVGSLANTRTPVPAQHELPPLPYAYDALEPFIDEQTMRIHHDKHHAAYVKGLNEAEAKLAEAREKDDFGLVQHWSRRAAFNGGGHFLHSMFWQVMAPPGAGGGGEPAGELLERITTQFGSFASFKKHFSEAAKAVEGSGWALLHHRPSDGALIILQAENQHKLSPWSTVPILGIDVWEHAYYLKYQNDRAAYVEKWWNVVNWTTVSKLMNQD